MVVIWTDSPIPSSILAALPATTGFLNAAQSSYEAVVSTRLDEILLNNLMPTRITENGIGLAINCC